MGIYTKIMNILSASLERVDTGNRLFPSIPGFSEKLLAD
jgi:hypothetical protein